MMQHLLKRLTLCAALAAGSLALPLTPASAVAQQAQPPYPNLSFPSDLTGQDAITALGGNLPAVAAWYGRTADELRRAFLSDQCCQIGRPYILGKDGRIRMKESFPKSTRPYSPHVDLYPIEDTFKLHSNRGARRTIYLRFKEQYESTDNLLYIQSVFQRVAEDFAPFDVDVTTEFVPASIPYRSAPDGVTYGYIVDIALQPQSYIDSYTGEVNLKSFDDPNDARRVLTVRTPWLNSPASTADVVSHLLGHAIGLRDEEINTASRQLYSGHSGPTGFWAPIMGYSTAATITQFSRGEFPNALNKEDSIAAIQRVIPLRADDVGDTPATAAALPVTVTDGQANGEARGIIGSQGDKDVFAFTAGRGILLAQALPQQAGANADLKLTLLDATGREVTSDDSPQWQSAMIFFYRIERPGTYYLQVSGTGSGYPNSDGYSYGYSDYGSLGNYSLKTTFTKGLGWAPNAILSATPETGPAPLAVKLDASQSNDDGEVRFINWDFGDGTKDETGALRTYTKVYQKAGNYPVTITVTDDEGNSTNLTKTITVTEPLANSITAKVDLGLLAMSKTSSAALGTLYVVDQNNKRVANATVRYTWSGLQQGQRSIVSQTQGSTVMSLASSQTGCFVLTVTGITFAGYTYNSAQPVNAQVCR